LLHPWKPQASIALVLAGALALGCESTDANTGRAISVLLVPVGEGTAGSEVETSLRDRIAERGDLEARDLSRLAALAAEETEDESDEEELAQRRLEQAQDAFSRFDYQGATTELGEALELLRAQARTPSGRRRLAGVHLELAMVLLVHGEREAALEEVRTCMHLDERCAPDPARHPPELAALQERVRAAEDTPRAELSVSTDPAGGTAALDGGEPQNTPASFPELPPGRHYLMLERDGYLPEVHVVNVAPGQTTERHFPLTLGPPPMRAQAVLRELERRGIEAEPRWRAQAASLGAADVLMILSLANGTALATFDARGEPLADPFRADGADREGALSYLDQVMPEPSVPWFGQWWFWTPLALGLSIGFGALVYALVRTPDVRLIGGGTLRD
jgi:hypothetical protein